MLRTRAAIEIARHQPPHGTVSVAVAIGQFEHARRRLPALRLVANALPSIAAADRDDAERLAPEEIECLLLRGRDDRREAERRGHFSRSFCSRLRSDDQNLV